MSGDYGSAIRSANGSASSSANSSPISRPNARAIASTATSTATASEAYDEEEVQEAEAVGLAERLFPDFRLSPPREPLGSEAPRLWPFQQRAVELLDAAVAASKRAPLLVLPTGSGKTVIAAHLMRRAVERRERALFLAPRRELVAQTSAKLAGQRHGVLLAGAESQCDLYAPVQIASIDTLLARAIRRHRLTLPEFDMVLVDEAHLSITAARKALLALWPNALRIGLTATPTRKDGRALGVLYDALIEPTTTAELMREGYLAPARYFSLGKPDLERVRTVAGDFHQGELDAAVNQPRLVADVCETCETCETWLKHAATRRSVVFATSIAHSVALCEGFLRIAVAAEHVQRRHAPGDARGDVRAIPERPHASADELLFGIVRLRPSRPGVCRARAPDQVAAALPADDRSRPAHG